MNAPAITSTGGAGNGRPGAGTAGSGAFAHYQLDPRFFNELFHDDGTPRTACRSLGQALARIPAEELARVQDSVHRRFLHEGITFTVLGKEEVSEQIIPIDCVPRILTAAEWGHIEAGIKQRLRAVNLFLRDIYHEGRSLRDGVVPPDLVLGCPQYQGFPTCWPAARRPRGRFPPCTGNTGCGRCPHTRSASIPPSLPWVRGRGRPAWWCSHRAATIPRTTSTLSSPARWGSTSWRGATW